VNNTALLLAHCKNTAMRLLIAALLLLVVGANADVYSVSVRWASDFDPLWVNIVISTVSDTGVVTDLGTIDSTSDLFLNFRAPPLIALLATLWTLTEVLCM
jgi:hypothetical protein